MAVISPVDFGGLFIYGGDEGFMVRISFFNSWAQNLYGALQ